jgi:elongation factor 1-alpha
MGVTQLIVLVNKMDAAEVNFSQRRFDEIKEALSPIIRRTAYKLEKVMFIPISAWTGDNLADWSDKMPWYTGPTFVAAIDECDEPRRLFDAPLRLPVNDVYKIGGVGTVVTGRIVSGTMTVGDVVHFVGGKGGSRPVEAQVKSIEMHHEAFEQALTGDQVGFCVNADAKELKRGMVCSSTAEPCSLAKEFTARLFILDAVNELRVGYTPIIDLGTAHIVCKWVEIIEKQKGRGEKEEQPRSVRKGDSCLVRLEPAAPLVVEEYRNFESLGRFAVREGNHLIAIGRVEAVNRKLEEVEIGVGQVTKSAAKS